MEDDRALLLRWRGGDLDAGNELFERHFDAIHRFFANKCARDAADLVQRTFLAAVQALDRFRGESSVRTFLFAIAHRELMAHFRKHQPDLAASCSSVADLEPRASSLLVKLAEKRTLLEALRNLPLELQVVLELFYWEGLSGPELCEVLEIPEGTVRSRLRRGLELLRARVTEMEQAPGALPSTLTTLDGWARRISEAMQSADAGSELAQREPASS